MPTCRNCMRRIFAGDDDVTVGTVEAIDTVTAAATEVRFIFSVMKRVFSSLIYQ